MIRALFFHPQERRLRAGWRLLIFAVLFFALLTALSVLLGLVFALAQLAAGGDFSPAAVMAQLSGPYGRLVSALGGLFSTLAVLWVMHWVDRRPLRDYGFHFSKRWWRDLGFGLLLGALLMALVFVVERAAGWVTVTGTLVSFVPGQGFWSGIVMSLVVYLCVGIYEEALTRGYLLRNLAEGLNWKRIGPKTALLLAYGISSAIFGLLHATNPNASFISTFNIFLAGLFLGLGYVLTGELAIPIGIHITWNFFQGNVFGFRVSGIGSSVSFLDIEQSGPALWTGGAFGPEAGLIGLLATGLGALLIILWVRWQYGAARAQERLAQYPAERSTADSE